MRFEPEYDPNPANKFRTIDSLSELPDAYVKEVAGLYGRIRKMIDEIQSNADAQKLDCDDAVVRYIAFQEMQILSLQKEIGLIYEGMKELAAVVDNQNPGNWDS